MIAVVPSPGVRVAVAESLSSDLVKVSEWLDLWWMKLNESKTNLFKFNKLYSERNITENIKLFLQLYMIMTDLLTCHMTMIVSR